MIKLHASGWLFSSEVQAGGNTDARRKKSGDRSRRNDEEAGGGILKFVEGRPFRVGAVAAVIFLSSPPCLYSCFLFLHTPRRVVQTQSCSLLNWYALLSSLFCAPLCRSQAYLASVWAVLRKPVPATVAGSAGSAELAKQLSRPSSVEEKKSFLENALRARQLMLQGVEDQQLTPSPRYFLTLGACHS